MLQGVTSFHELATPIIGRLRSSSFSPIARNIERCGARSGPSVTAQLRCLSFRSAIKRQPDNTARTAENCRGGHRDRPPVSHAAKLPRLLIVLPLTDGRASPQTHDRRDT